MPGFQSGGFSLDRLGQLAIVLGERGAHCFRVFLPAPCRPFDISEQEGDRAGREAMAGIMLLSRAPAPDLMSAKITIPGETCES